MVEQGKLTYFVVSLENLKLGARVAESFDCMRAKVVWKERMLF